MKHTLILLQIKWGKNSHSSSVVQNRSGCHIYIHIDVGWVRNPSASFKSKHRNEVGRNIE